MGALLVVYAAWQVLRWPDWDRTIVGDAFFYPSGLVSVWAAAAASRRCRSDRRLRMTWRLLAIGFALYLAGDIAQTVYEALGQVPYPSIADVLYLLFYPIMLCGLLCVPGATGSGRERIRLGLDLAVVTLGGIALVIYVVLGPTVVQSGPDGLQTAISIAYPVGDMVLLVGLAYVLLRRTAASGRLAFQLMAAGVVFFIAADLVYGWITLHSVYHGGDPVDTLWMIAIALFAIAGSAQAAPPVDAESAPQAVTSSASWLPYVALLLGYGLLLFTQRHDPLLPGGAIVLISLALTALVSVRQFIAQRDLVDTQGQLSHQSLHDPLTGLPNRVLVIDRAERMLLRARRLGAPVAALYIDIDGFKRVNDSLGHRAGDEVLRVVAARLRSVVRDSDTVGRLGGDEFVLLLDGPAAATTPESVAQRVCEILRAPLEVEPGSGRALTVSASVGIARRGAGTADDLLREADLALYAAKRAGRNRWLSFESGMESQASARLALELDLRQALARDELFLLCQPLVDLRTEALSGVEALIRWQHPQLGLVAPGAFIDVAEETGLIAEIGRWVLQTACRHGARWQDSGRPLAIAVNVSAVQLRDGRLVDDVAHVLATTGLDPRLLTLEITETTLMHDAQAAARWLHALKALGVRIAIDDFGTGYSSLAYLGQFPVDALKIDRSFVSGITESNEARVLIHALIQLSKALGLETVGEGIEERGQLDFLRDEGCESGQGFMFSRPVTPEAIGELLSGGVEVPLVAPEGGQPTRPTPPTPPSGEPERRPATARSTAAPPPPPARSTTR